jgi:hypothetical protein
MRLIGFGAASACALFLASCCTPAPPPPPPPPPPGFITCADHQPGGGSNGSTSDAAAIVPAPAGGSGLKINPAPFDPVSGVCIDSSGNIHLYANYARRVTFAVTFAVPGQSPSWPSPAEAMEVGPYGGRFGAWPWSSGAPAVSGGTLSFTLPAEGPNHRYIYQLEYVDGSGEHVVEPMIVNH